MNTPPVTAAAPAVTGRQVTKIYEEGSGQVTALDAVDVRIPAGRLVAIMGPSGSGKSTLMHCLAGLDTPGRGQRPWKPRRCTRAPGARPGSAPEQARSPTLAEEDTEATGAGGKRMPSPPCPCAAAGQHDNCGPAGPKPKWL